MAIHYLILLSRQGKVRLAKWFTTLSPKEKAKIIKDVSQLVLARRTRMCNFLEYKGQITSDIIFNFQKAYFILDELLLAGEMQESSKKNVLRVISAQDSIEDTEAQEEVISGLREIGLA
ncbi:hypothetical protein SS1G_10252 [Sclerotinia sclerotiorum 1980 UF-70]|uniref:AP complex subunit sigma n=1 Tax=Sclerotinia sclerotiorum (strain ATCC 18683 / 1980 / Ss-1) TaxID=665079 RepID=A7EY37_SCLS1|nr:hypothetical protein SS1G_10252 [Sclerotinia sclerotiorum 1980 UF-70]EDN94379.1 hypothetical protein SS1G_10252 [Sclerotinia sclerotiorum 1980 UF-70]